MAFFAAAFLVVVFFAAAVFVVARLAVAFLAAAFFIVRPAPETPPVRLPFGAFLTATSPPRGSFFAPLTRSLKPCPARNRGTEVFLTRTRSPVWGLRA